MQNIQFWKKTKFKAEVKSTLYDLTHLEVNTIIKDEMDASKAPDNLRLLLHSISKKYHMKLIELGNKYRNELGIEKPANGENLFRGEINHDGSSYLSFKELKLRAVNAIDVVNENNSEIVNIPEDDVKADLKMLSRIATISQDVRDIIQKRDFDKNKIDENDKKNRDPEGNVTNRMEVADGEIEFDKYIGFANYRKLSTRQADKYEPKPDLELRELMVLRKANDMGTERVVLQTIIGMDGDVTTRISQAFANNPVMFINEMHHESINISVDFWKTLVNIVVKLGEQIVKWFR